MLPSHCQPSSCVNTGAMDTIAARRDCVSARTVFATTAPIAAGNSAMTTRSATKLGAIRANGASR